MAVNQQLVSRLGRVQYPYANTPVRPQTQAQQASRDLQLQSTVSQMAPSQATVGLAQQLGSSLAKLATQQNLQNVQTQSQQIQQAGQLGLQQQGMQAQQRVASQQLGARESEMAGVQRLSAISEQGKREVYDLRRQFAQDEMGRKFTNERQLSDFKLATAKSDEDFRNYTSQVELAYDRKRQLLDMASQKIGQELTIANQMYNQALSGAQDLSISALQKKQREEVARQQAAQIERLEQARRDLEISINQTQADAQAAAARRQMWGTVVGAVIGGALALPTGGLSVPAGAMIGGSLGGAAGTFVK